MADDARNTRSRSRRRRRYVADQSDPSRNQYVFAYTITITNTGSTCRRSSSAATGSSPTASTRSRKCKGLGVVGQQPLLKPGESFEYTSGATLPTPVGTMRGSYQMVAEDGARLRRRRSRRSRCRCRASCIDARIVGSAVRRGPCGSLPA